MRSAAVIVALALAAVASACRSAARSDGGTGTIDLDATVIDIDGGATGDTGTTGDTSTTGDTGTTGDAPAAPRRICDGSDDIRLAYSVPVNPTRVLAFTADLYELGAEFLYVDGHCHYWMREPLPADRFGAWRAYREGELTAAQEAELHDAVSYDDFTAGAPPCMGPLAQDASPTLLWDGRMTHTCRGILQAPADWPMRIELARSTTPMTGPMRVMVGSQSVSPGAPIYPWPLAGTPASYEIDYAASMRFGVSTLVTDPAELAALRGLRDRAIADGITSPGLFQGAINVEPSGTVISMRDDVPFANQSGGLWAPP
jgi:hypothetical protein